MTIHEIERIISERTGRTVTFSPLAFVDGIPRKGFLVDGVPLVIRWSPEEPGALIKNGTEKDPAEAFIDTIVQSIKDYKKSKEKE